MKVELFLMSACLTTTLLTSAGTVLAADVPPLRARVGLVDAIDLPDRMEETRAHLRELFEASVRERGLDMVQVSQPSCGDTNCLADVARAAGADALVVARGGRSAGRDYHVDLGLWQASNAQVIPAVSDCTFCTGPQMAEAVVKAARPLLDRVVAMQTVPAVLPSLPPAVVTPSNPSPSDKLEPRRGRRIVGWSLVGLGAATAIAGGIIWNLDGKGTDCIGSNCRNTYRTQGTGVALVAVGVVGAGAGLWLALDPLGKRDMAITVGPSGAMLAGSF